MKEIAIIYRDKSRILEWEGAKWAGEYTDRVGVSTRGACLPIMGSKNIPKVVALHAPWWNFEDILLLFETFINQQVFILSKCDTPTDPPTLTHTQPPMKFHLPVMHYLICVLTHISVLKYLTLIMWMSTEIKDSTYIMWLMFQTL